MAKRGMLSQRAFVNFILSGQDAPGASPPNRRAHPICLTVSRGSTTPKLKACRPSRKLATVPVSVTISGVPP